MRRHFGIPHKPEHDTEINALAGTLTFAIIIIIAAVCKWGGL